MRIGTKIRLKIEPYSQWVIISFRFCSDNKVFIDE